MRWKKRHVKRFNDIIKKYYSKKLDPMIVMLRDSIGTRKWPNLLLNNRHSKNRYEVLRYEECTSFLSRFISVPCYYYSKVKRSKVQGVLSGYRMLKIEELNEVLGTDYTHQCFKNYSISMEDEDL